VSDSREALTSALSDRYQIERELGAGGMATVYLAEDLKHRRQVAIKVLRPELSATLGPERFVREIEIAANLNHPHILPLHDSGEADGFLYYVMPFVEGESLRDRLERDTKLSVPDAVRITDQVASALSYAHERGVVHRDIKPENILCAGDQAIVADFGIARAVEVAGGEKLTGTGIAVGTPAYMSPEQAVGTDIDARSDVYALGCVVYEMVSGRAPFEGETPQGMLAKHAVGTVPSLRTSDPSVPLFLERAVERALAKQPADRFQSASAFAEALTSEMVVARVGGQSRQRRVVSAAAVVVALLAAAWALFTYGPDPTYERLAVLPPTNLMNDPDEAYFVQGMHNALITELQRAGVAVIARTSVMQYENMQKPIREIASELGVDAIVEASVLRVADSVEIEVKLVDGTTQQYVADPIARRSDLRDIERLYRGLTSAIAVEIQAVLTPQAETRLASARPVNKEAYEAYLRGQFHFTSFSFETALRYYALALEEDAGYALAYVGISLVWAGLNQQGLVPPSEAGPRARAAALRALELDSTLAEVHYASAIVKTWIDWDWPAAEAAFSRSIELNPNYPDVRAFYSHYLCAMKRPDEALFEMERAVELDPLNPLIQALRGQALYMLGRYDEALEQFQRLARAEPNYPLGVGGLQNVYGAKGMYEEALAAANSYYAVMQFSQAEEALAQGYAEGGFHAAMKRAADAWAERRSEAYVLPSEIAVVYGLAGEDSLTLDWLEQGFEEHDPGLPYLSAWPTFGSLHDSPQFLDLVQRMGLPER